MKILRRRKYAPQRIRCPICHTHGYVTEYHPHHNLQNIRYVIVHDEYLPGYWGKTGRTKIRKRRRCYIKSVQNHRILDELLKLHDRKHFWRTLERQTGVASALSGMK